MLGGVTLGCGPISIELVLPPLGDEHEAVLFAVERPAGSASVDIWASALTDGEMAAPAALLRAPRGEIDARVFAFVYDLPLDEGVGVDKQGWLEPRPGQPTHKPPDPSLTFAATVDGAAGGGFAKQTGPPEFFHHILLPGPPSPNTCQRRRYERTHLTLGAGHRASFALTIDDSTFLVGAEAGQVWRIDRAASSSVSEVMVEPVDPAQPAGDLVAATRTAHGDLWFGDSAGYAHRATLDGDRLRTERYSTSTVSGSVVGIGAGRVSGGSEVVTLSKHGQVFRFTDDARDVRLPSYDFGEDASRAWSLGGVAWLDPGDAVAVWPKAEQNARLRVQSAEAIEISGATSVANVAGVGAVVGTAEGRFHVDDGAGWRPLVPVEDIP